jgi:deoxyribonuclease-4
MPRLGAHMSIAGGLHQAFERLRKVRGEALQIFLFNQRQWRVPELTQDQVSRFLRAWEEGGFVPVAAHDSYLINLASPDDELRNRSIEAFAEELRRCKLLGIRYLVAHPGAHCGMGREAGIERFVLGLDKAMEMAEGEGVRVLIETTAGQGTSLGGSLEEISAILQGSRFGELLGVCIDTCHLFAAGFDLGKRDGYNATIDALQETIGLHRILWFHLNDSKGELGSRIDRHAHIGKGKMGLEAFRHLLNDPRFKDHPMVLETPKGKDLKEDRRNLRVLRSLLNA